MAFAGGPDGGEGGLGGGAAAPASRPGLRTGAAAGAGADGAAFCDSAFGIGVEAVNAGVDGRETWVAAAASSGEATLRSGLRDKTSVEGLVCAGAGGASGFFTSDAGGSERGAGRVRGAGSALTIGGTAGSRGAAGGAGSAASGARRSGLRALGNRKKSSSRFTTYFAVTAAGVAA